MAPEWFQDWSGERCAIVASGASATPQDVAKLRARCRVVVVNNSYELAPWADVLYAADRQWWAANPKARDFARLKVTSSQPVATDVKFVPVMPLSDRGIHVLQYGRTGVIGRGGSGFQALNIALQFGAIGALLVGFDFRGKHWHEDHRPPLHNPPPQRLAMWASRLDSQAEGLAAHGVSVINASLGSALQAFEKKPIDDVLRDWLVADENRKGLGLDTVPSRDALHRGASPEHQAEA